MNQSAFPIIVDSYLAAKGLSKREYFAALALQALLIKNDDTDTEILGELALRAADQLIVAINKESK